MKYTLENVSYAIKQLIENARAEAYAEGVRDGENKTGDGLYRRILIAHVLGLLGTTMSDDEYVVTVDVRYETDRTLDRWILVDDGIDPANGVFHRYIVRRT